MPTIALKHQTVKALKPGATRIDYQFEELTGFGVRVATTGRKTFQIMYRPKGSRRFRRSSIGVVGIMSLATATQIAREKLEQAAKGRDPGAELHQRRNAQTFEDLARAYIEEYAIGSDVWKRASELREKNRALSLREAVQQASADLGRGPAKRSWTEDHRILFGSEHRRKTGKAPATALVKIWGTRPVAEIAPRDVKTLLKQTAKRGTRVLNHVETGITSVYDRYAYDKEKRDALDRWARHLATIIPNEKKPGAEVIRFSTRG